MERLLALISGAHMEKVLGYVEAGKAAGAQLLTGGERLQTGALDKGNFMTPAVFDACRDDMTIVQEEIFGPVMCVLDFKTEEEVIRRANDTRYGLSAGIFTQNLPRAHRVVGRGAPPSRCLLARGATPARATGDERVLML